MIAARRGRWDVVGLLAAAALLAAWTWRRWADPLVDFGRELYAAWRVSEGALLGRDLAWLNGPLSVGWNALCMRVFGVAAGTIFGVNLALLAVAVWLLHGRALALGDRFGAALAVGFFVAVSAFGDYGGINNYTWAAPYAHELTHGMLLAIASLALLERWAETGRPTMLVLAGLALGLVALTKVEMLVAGAGAVLARLAAGGRAPARARGPAAWTAFAAAVCAPTLIAFGLHVPALGSAGAWAVALGAFEGLDEPALMRMPFYREGMGLTDPARSIDRMVHWSLAWAALVGVPAAIALRLRGVLVRHPLAVGAALLAGCLPLLLARRQIEWFEAARPLPLAVVALFTATGIARLRAGDPLTARRTAARLAWTAFAGLALAKMILHARLVHYGFVLAVPATLLVVVAATSWLPRWIDERGGSGRLVRAFLLGVLAATALAHLEVSADWRARKSQVLGAGGDRLRVAGRGAIAASALAEIEDRMGARESLLVLPEGVMLNYLARRRSPTRFVNFMPPELAIFGEDAMLAAFASSPPDLVALVHKDSSEYGARFFGQDYGRRLAAWIEARYEPVALFGEEPFVERGFGVALLARRR